MFRDHCKTEICCELFDKINNLLNPYLHVVFFKNCLMKFNVGAFKLEN